jgi:hypothetical protein
MYSNASAESRPRMGINVESRMTEHARPSIQKTAVRPPGLRPKLKANGLRKSATRFSIAASRREHCANSPISVEPSEW